MDGVVDSSNAPEEAGETGDSIYHRTQRAVSHYLCTPLASLMGPLYSFVKTHLGQASYVPAAEVAGLDCLVDQWQLGPTCAVGYGY